MCDGLREGNKAGGAHKLQQGVQGYSQEKMWGTYSLGVFQGPFVFFLLNHSTLLSDSGQSGRISDTFCKGLNSKTDIQLTADLLARILMTKQQRMNKFKSGKVENVGRAYRPH